MQVIFFTHAAWIDFQLIFTTKPLSCVLIIWPYHYILPETDNRGTPKKCLSMFSMHCVSCTGPRIVKNANFFPPLFSTMNVKDLDSYSHDILFNCNGFITSPRYQMQFIRSFSFSEEGWPIMLRAFAFQQRRLHNSRFFFISFVKIGFRRAKRASHTRPWGVWGESHQSDPPFSPSLYGFRLACLAASAFLS